MFPREWILEHLHSAGTCLGSRCLKKRKNSNNQDESFLAEIPTLLYESVNFDYAKRKNEKYTPSDNFRKLNCCIQTKSAM